MNEQELKKKIKSLYEELIEEKKGFYLPGSGYRTKEPPSGLRYAEKALELLDVAKKLASIDSAKYNTLELQITINKDVENVRGYFYKYDKSCKPTSKSIAEIQQMMSDTTSQNYRDFVCKVDDDKV